MERLISSSFEMFQETSMPQLKTLVLMLGMATVNTPSVEHVSFCCVGCVHGSGRVDPRDEAKIGLNYYIIVLFTTW